MLGANVEIFGEGEPLKVTEVAFLGRSNRRDSSLAIPNEANWSLRLRWGRGEEKVDKGWQRLEGTTPAPAAEQSPHPGAY